MGDQFESEVFPSELKYLQKRWQTVYSRRQQAETGEQREGRLSTLPTAANHLVGMAFSGGGIRSATINLGIAQALHRRGALDHVDYLSTVSGGGYLGASLSTIMRDGAEFPYKVCEGAKESPYLTWLRNHSNYLAERGVLDYVRMVAVLLRGVLINFLVVVPFLLVLSVGFAYWAGNTDAGGVWFKSGGWSDAYFLTRWAAVLTLVYILTFPVMVRVFKILAQERSEATGSESTVKLRDRVERTFSGLLLVVVGLAAIESVPPLLYYFHKLEFSSAVAAVLGGTSIAALTVVGRLLAYFKGAARTLVMWVVGLLGLLLPLLFVLYVAEGLIWDWKVSEGSTGEWKKVSWPAWLLMGVFVGLMVGGVLASIAARVLGRRSGVPRMTGVGGAGLLGFAVGLGGLLLSAGFGRLSGFTPQTFTLALAGVIWLFCWLSVNVNLTSLLPFYRDRLSAAYLVGVDTDTRTGRPVEEIPLDDVAVEEDLDLQKICQGERDGEKASIAPYHLLNVTHNLQGSGDPGVRERNADFFMFSKKFYGGPRTGYCSTETLEAVFPQMDLATAMAISAAAASPNMGGNTIGLLVAIMTLFNIRLGYWVPNPLQLATWAQEKGAPLASTLWGRFSWRVRPLALLKEISSGLNETARWVNVSDGGHLENLALYELLRRRCKFIIAGDGEADPEIRFGSLARLKRFASIDLGIEIDIDLDDVRKGADGRSQKHCAFGRISYPARNAGEERETGYLLYIKSTVTGDEDEVIREYRANHPAFPHESTADQFFDEGQFEAYRALGFHATEQLFGATGSASLATFSQFETWFKGLEASLAPGRGA